MSAFSQRLRVALAAQDCSQSELAELVGVSPMAVNHWCAGRNIPPIDKISRICQELEISADFLLAQKPISFNQLMFWVTT